MRLVDLERVSIDSNRLPDAACLVDLERVSIDSDRLPDASIFFFFFWLTSKFVCLRLY